MTPIRLGVLGSGRGSNFLAIAKNIAAGNLNADVAIVLSDKDSPILRSAAEMGFPVEHVSPASFSSKDAYDAALVERLMRADVDLVVFAGYMRIVSPLFIHSFPNRIVNIHPSLLPLFKGLHPQRQALEAGVKESGCTVHYVTNELDGGPIIAQAVVPVLPDDTEDTLAARILVEEHKLYTEAIRKITFSIRI